MSDPDHVQRYFALVPPAGDIPDAVLVAALEEWVQRRPGRAAEQIIAVLTPDQPDATAWELAARVLRRAAARTLTCSPRQAAALLPVVLGLLPLPVANGLGLGPEDPAVAWLAQLLVQADGPPPEELCQLVDRPASVDSPLWSLIRAIRLATPGRSQRQRADPQTGIWLSGVIGVCVDMAWRRFLGHCRLGDDAPMEPAGGLLRWLEEKQGQAEVNRRLREPVDDGLPIADLAARLVEVGTIPATGQGTLVGFDREDLLRRLAFDRVRAQKAALATANEGVTGIDENDVTWANRRRAAARELLAALDVADEVIAGRLPAIAPVQNNPLLNHRPALYSAANPRQPDLRAQASMLIPTGNPPPLNLAAPGPIGQDGEQAILGLLAASPITAWLAQVAPSWHVEPDSWEITETDGRIVTTAASMLHLDQPAASESQHAQALSLTAQFHTGLAANSPHADSREPVLLLTVEVAIWLTALTADRRPDEREHAEEPLPAALSLHEAYDLPAALTRCATTAHSALAQLTQSSDRSREILVDLAMETRPSIGSVIDLSKIRRVGAGRQSQYRQTITTHAIPIDSSSLSYTPTLDDITVSALSEWLLLTGYRDYEQQLRDLWQPPVPSSGARPDIPERESQFD